MPEQPSELGNPLFLSRGQGEALASQFCLFLKRPQTDVPVSIAAVPGEGSRALLSTELWQLLGDSRAMTDGKAKIWRARGVTAVQTQHESMEWGELGSPQEGSLSSCLGEGGLMVLGWGCGRRLGLCWGCRVHLGVKQHRLAFAASETCPPHCVLCGLTQP